MEVLPAWIQTQFWRSPGWQVSQGSPPSSCPAGVASSFRCWNSTRVTVLGVKPWFMCKVACPKCSWLGSNEPYGCWSLYISLFWGASCTHANPKLATYFNCFLYNEIINSFSGCNLQEVHHYVKTPLSAADWKKTSMPLQTHMPSKHHDQHSVLQACLKVGRQWHVNMLRTCFTSSTFGSGVTAMIKCCLASITWSCVWLLLGVCLNVVLNGSRYTIGFLRHHPSSAISHFVCSLVQCVPTFSRDENLCLSGSCTYWNTNQYQKRDSTSDSRVIRLQCPAAADIWFWCELLSNDISCMVHQFCSWRVLDVLLLFAMYLLARYPLLVVLK